MPIDRHSVSGTGRTPWAERLRARRVLCMAAMLLPCAAHPQSLEALLQLPLERLMQMQIVPARLSLPAASRPAAKPAEVPRHA